VVDRSRRPRRSPTQTAAPIEQAVVELRKRWPDWGAAKLRDVLLREHADYAPLAERTVHRILTRHQLIRPEDRHRPALQRFERSAANELWQMDFKGPPAFNQGASVGPLSILDDHSRYVLTLQQLGSTQLVGVQATLEKTFRQYGLPEGMLMDHGTPWWNPSSPWGLTALAVWIMRQGVRLWFSGIRHPQTQGKVERMHGALKQAARKRGANLLEQSWLDMFRQEYNHIRPHAALNMATPASRWCPSPRPFQSVPPEWKYPSSLRILRLGTQGQFAWRGRRWDISSALRNQTVGLAELEDRALVYFYRTPLRELHASTGESFPIPTDPYASLENRATKR
jgi:transposase InsO family protein